MNDMVKENSSKVVIYTLMVNGQQVVFTLHETEQQAIDHVERGTVLKQVYEMLEQSSISSHMFEGDHGRSVLDLDGLIDFLVTERHKIIVALTVNKGPETEKDW